MTFCYRKILSGNLTVDGGPWSPNLGDRGVRTLGTAESELRSSILLYFRAVGLGLGRRWTATRLRGIGGGEARSISPPSTSSTRASG